MKPFSVLVIGAGHRGRIYADFMKRYPDVFRIAAVCETDKDQRDRFASEHNVSPGDSYSDFSTIPKRHPVADAVVIATPDQSHFEMARRVIGQGSALLLEKPVGTTPDQCRTLARLAEKSGVPVVVCHVLRYTAFFRKIHELVQSGEIGRLQSIVHTEEIAPFHMAHSYVRGRWARVADSTPLVLAKCSHDLDLMQWYAGAKPVRIFSQGGLRHFHKSAAPSGATARCTDGCPHSSTCPHDAVRLYMQAAPIKEMLTQSDSRVIRVLSRLLLTAPGFVRALGFGRFVDHKGWPVDTITHDLSDEGIRRALREGPFGRCVFKSDNDQVDHQTTTIGYANGVTGTLVFHGFSSKEGRRIRIVGDQGSIRGTYGSGARLEIVKRSRAVNVRIPSELIGHSEGDHGVIRHFADVLRGRAKPETSIQESLASHECAFAAYRSMKTGRVIAL